MALTTNQVCIDEVEFGQKITSACCVLKSHCQVLCCAISLGAIFGKELNFFPNSKEEKIEYN